MSKGYEEDYMDSLKERPEKKRCGTCLWMKTFKGNTHYYCGYYSHDSGEKGGMHAFPEALRPILMATGGYFVTGPQKGHNCIVWGFNRNLL